MEPIAIVYHSGVTNYDFGPGHPFRGDRFPRFMMLIEEHGFFSNPHVILVQPDAASDDDLLLVHSEEYIREVNRRAVAFTPLSGDTPLSPSIVDAARLIVGTSIKASELVENGTVRHAVGVGGGLHHAGRSYGGGFCVFNDVAICVQSMLERLGLERVLIFDTDVHAGNGTMDIFYEEPKVLYVSVHQDPRTIYPGTGHVEQIGNGLGEGYTVNIPLSPGADDECMRLILEEIFKPLVREFEPQIIVRNGGSDPHFLDGLGNLNLTFRGLRNIGEAVAGAAISSKCGVVDLYCSGYNPKTVIQGWLAILSGGIGFDVALKERESPQKSSDRLVEETRNVIDALKEILREYWSLD